MEKEKATYYGSGCAQSRTSDVARSDAHKGPIQDVMNLDI
jgi:hypothetical protein